MSQPIWYDSTEAGAPTLNNVAGSLLEVLRACLINGFGSKTVTSIAVASGVATVTCAAHGFSGSYGKLVLMAGSAEPLLNGNKQIGNLLTNSFTFPAAGVADGTYTGTLSAKRAPLGWTEPHSGTNKAIFARTHVEATAMMLRVDDSRTLANSQGNARVFAVETATGLDAWTDRFPTAAQTGDGLWWYTGQDTATAKPWAVFGDTHTLYVVLPAVNGTIGNGGYAVHGFGDIVPAFAPDPYACMMGGAGANVASGSFSALIGYVGPMLSGGGSAALTVARSETATIKSLPVGLSGPHTTAGAMGRPESGPTRADKFMLAGPPVVSEADNGLARGFMPGIYYPLARAPLSAIAQFSVIDAVLGSDKKFVHVNHLVGTSLAGTMLIDVSGTWR